MRAGIGETTTSVLLTEAQIADLVASLAQMVESSFITPPRRSILVPVMTGALFLAADLARRLPLRWEIMPVRVRSYLGRCKGEAVLDLGDLDQLGDPELSGAQLLVVDEVLDTGETLELLTRLLKVRFPCATVQSLVLVDKGRSNFECDFVGRQLPNVWLTGYGMDGERGGYRGQPFITTP